MNKSFKELWKGKDFTDFGNYKPKPHVENKKKSPENQNQPLL